MTHPRPNTKKKQRGIKELPFLPLYFFPIKGFRRGIGRTNVRPYTFLRFYLFTFFKCLHNGGVRLLTEGRIFRTHVD